MIVTEEKEMKSKSAKSPEKKLELASDAIAHALRRVESDPDFRWHMYGTETHSKLVVAHAAITGRPLKQLEKEHDQRMKNEDGVFETPRHKKLDDLRSDIQEIDIESLDIDDARTALEKLKSKANDI